MNMLLLLFFFDPNQTPNSALVTITTQESSALIRVPSAQSASGFFEIVFNFGPRPQRRD
jgi:hypothetical protein